MIYRIKIVDAEGKFVRYADPVSTCLLHPYPDGSGVAKAHVGYVTNSKGMSVPVVVNDDVSDTNKVEYGIAISDENGVFITMFENDIFHVSSKLSEEFDHVMLVVFINGHFEMKDKHNRWDAKEIPFFNSIQYQYIGNANLNPGLLGDK